MITIQEAQAMDYLLKWMLSHERFPLVDKNLKLVIDLNRSHWYGDFVNYESGHTRQLFIDDSGSVENTWLYSTGSNATSILHKIKMQYSEEVKRFNWGNPFLQMSDLPLLFNTLTKLVKLAGIQQDDSPIYPYLLNAKSLDGKQSLPFLNLDGDTIKVVSIIELPEEK